MSPSLGLPQAGPGAFLFPRAHAKLAGRVAAGAPGVRSVENLLRAAEEVGRTVRE